MAWLLPAWRAKVLGCLSVITVLLMRSIDLVGSLRGLTLCLDLTLWHIVNQTQFGLEKILHSLCPPDLNICVYKLILGLDRKP